MSSASTLSSEPTHRTETWSLQHRKDPTHDLCGAQHSHLRREFKMQMPRAPRRAPDPGGLGSASDFAFLTNTPARGSTQSPYSCYQNRGREHSWCNDGCLVPWLRPSPTPSLPVRTASPSPVPRANGMDHIQAYCCASIRGQRQVPEYTFRDSGG